jgi:hypothetical protein
MLEFEYAASEEFMMVKSTLRSNILSDETVHKQNLVFIGTF